MRRTVAQQAGVTIRVGVCSDRRNLLVEQLLKEAEAALSQAKANGHARVEWADSVPPLR